MFHLILNAYWEALDFELPPTGERGAWRRWIDTGYAAPGDIVEWRLRPACFRNLLPRGAAFGSHAIHGSGLKRFQHCLS